jgi:hypothetical protein
MRIGADRTKRELGHVGFCNDHSAGCTQPAHNGRVGSGRWSFLGEDLRRRPRRLAGDVEQILDADNRAVEWPERYAGFGAGVSGIGGRTRGVGINGQACLGALAFRIGNPV